MPVPERPPLCLRRLTVFRDHSPLTRSCFCFLYFVSFVFCKPKLVFGFCQLTFRAGENPLLHVAAPERPGPRLCVRADGRIAPDRQPEPREHLTPRVCGVTADHATPHSRPHWPGVPLVLKLRDQPGPLRSCLLWPFTPASLPTVFGPSVLEAFLHTPYGCHGLCGKPPHLGPPCSLQLSAQCHPSDRPFPTTLPKKATPVPVSSLTCPMLPHSACP